MTAERFNNFSLPQQLYYTMKCGVHISSLHEKEHSIDLYQCGNFYIELYYKHGSLDCSFAFAFTHTNHLKKYLEQISIADLFEN
jgi:hypothetical protein